VQFHITWQAVKDLEAKIEKRQQDLNESTVGLEALAAKESQLNEQLEQLALEAEEAAKSKQSLENEIRQHLAPMRLQKEQLNSVKREIVTAERRLASARQLLQEFRDQIAQRYGSAQSDEARRTNRIREAEEELASHRPSLEERRRQLKVYHDEYEGTEPPLEHAKKNLSAVKAQYLAVSKRVTDLKASDANSIAVFGQKCVSVLEKVRTR
jgi:chromosome segregation ATPase